MSSASIPRKLYCQVSNQCTGSVGVRCFVDRTHESRSLFPEVWQHKSWLRVPGRGPFSEVEERPFESFFSNRQKSLSWKMWCSKSSSPRSMLWGSFYKAWLFSVEAIRTLQYWSISPFISCSSKRSGSQVHQTLWLSQKVIVYEYKRGWIWDLEGPNGNVFCQGILRISADFAT